MAEQTFTIRTSQPRELSNNLGQMVDEKFKKSNGLNIQT